MPRDLPQRRFKTNVIFDLNVVGENTKTNRYETGREILWLRTGVTGGLSSTE
jgi:hypothetical protein